MIAWPLSSGWRPKRRRALADPASSPSASGGRRRPVAECPGHGAGPLYQFIAANRQDQTVTSYETFEDLVSYCSLSANPVGHLVLGALGLTSPERVVLADFMCTGLQLAEHWQDVAEDSAAGRVYLPQEDLRHFDVTPSELEPGKPISRALRGLMVFEVARARRWLDEGAPLMATLSGRPKWAVAGFWAGGQAALDAIAAHRFDVLGGPPHPARRVVARYLVSALLGPGPRQETR